MKHLFFLALVATMLLSGCQLFVDFDRNLLDGGDGGGKSRLETDPLDGGMAD